VIHGRDGEVRPADRATVQAQPIETHGGQERGERRSVPWLRFTALVIGAVGLFVAGAITSRFTTRVWWLAGLRQLMFGAIAAAATYLVGMAIGISAAG